MNVHEFVPGDLMYESNVPRGTKGRTLLICAIEHLRNGDAYVTLLDVMGGSRSLHRLQRAVWSLDAKVSYGWGVMR